MRHNPGLLYHFTIPYFRDYHRTTEEQALILPYIYKAFNKLQSVSNISSYLTFTTTASYAGWVLLESHFTNEETEAQREINLT